MTVRKYLPAITCISPAGIQAFRHSGIQAFRHSGIRASRLQGFKAFNFRISPAGFGLSALPTPYQPTLRFGLVVGKVPKVRY
jgi:hypothetical protein